ncbi:MULTISPECIES: protein rep [unclassified Streptococcus]|uniref:protein rep n=1 Tax=unclassified Streptococcus TaxID=2608887 RepID=UPI001565D1FA|nr:MULTISPECIES: protein rep [unclassified Streptococcus]
MSDVKNQVFQDISKTGKDRKWRERKLKNIELAGQLDILGYRSFERVYQCAEVLKFVEQSDGTKKLYQSYFCKNKLCALCNWRRSMKYSYQASKIVEEAMIRQPKGRFLFLTLTVKNVIGQELNQAMTDILIGFNRLMKYKKIDKNMIGFLRATEVTYSKKLDSYHPHLHVLLMVKPGYFRSKDDYLNQEEWTELWKKAMKLDYTPMVDIRAVKADKGKGLKGAILETAKYPVKPFDVIDEKTDFTAQEKLQIVDDMLTGLHRKRQIGFGKLFKEIKKQFDFDDLEDGNLVQTGDETESRATGREIVAIWNWERKNYYIKS